MQMKRFLSTFSLLLLLWSLSPGVCRAETSEADSVASDHSMGEVVVTATRTRKLLKDTPILTRVVNRKDIEMADATDLRDLLQQELPGVEFTYSMNQKLNMNMSGFAGQSVLILVDGERLAGETMENVDFSRIDMNNVERIEIVRGAQSALYGAGAVGGVINIITRGASRPWSLNLNGRLADHREQRYGGVLGLSKGRVGNMLDVQYTSVDNYTVCMDYADECQFRNVYGGRTWNVKDKFTYRPTDVLRLTARAGYYFKELTTDADVYERFRDFSGGLRAEWDITGKDHLEVSMSYDQYDKSDLLRLWERDVMDYRNLQMSVRTMYNRTFRQKDILTVGGDYMRDYLHTYQFSDGKERVQYTGDLFAQYDCFLGKRWELIGAGRWDYFSDAKGASQLTGKLAARYTFDSFILRAGYAGGFRAPTLKEKYSYFNMVGDIYVKGNEALEAERSHNFNLSAEYSWQNYNFSASASYNTIANRITSSAPRQGTMGEYYVQYINLPRARVLGVELLALGQWTLQDGHKLRARANYVYTREWVSQGGATPYCPARPHSLNLRMDWDKQWTSFYGTTLSVLGRVLSAVDYETIQMDYPFTPRQVHNPAYTIWKVQLQNRLGKGVRFNIAVDNVFNYSPEVYYFNSPVTLGINLMAGISVDVDRLW